MKASVERQPLLAALSRISGVVDRGAKNIPIIGNVAVAFSDDRLELRGTDLDMEAVEVIPARIADPGRTTISADKLYEIVRNVAGGAEVAISDDTKDPRVVVMAGASKFRLPSLPYDDFPRFPAENLGEPWTIDAKTLADMVSRVAFCRDSTDPLKAMSCTHIVGCGEQLHVVGVHAAGMALRREPRPTGCDISEILLPKHTGQLVNWLADIEGDVEVSTSPSSLVRIRAGGAMLTSKVYGGHYVNYLNALKEDHEAFCRTDQDALKASIKRVMITGESKSGSVRLAIADGGVKLFARNDAIGEGADEIACDYDAAEASLLLNATRFASALAQLRGDRVELGFAPVMETGNHASGQVIIRAPADTGFIINLMQPRA